MDLNTFNQSGRDRGRAPLQHKPSEAMVEAVPAPDRAGLLGTNVRTAFSF
jgi:hypothetical protein